MAQPPGGWTPRRRRRNASPTARSASMRSPRARSSSGPAPRLWSRAAACADSCSTSAETCGSAARSRERSASHPRGRIRNRPSRSRVIAVKDRAVATSGSSQRGFRIDDRWYSHIFDPRPGCPPIGSPAPPSSPRGRPTPTPWPRSATCSQPEESLRLVHSIPDTECLIIDREGRITRSEGWRRYEASRTAQLALADGAGTSAAADPRPARPTSRRHGRLVGPGFRARWSTSRSISPRGRAGATGGPTWPSGSRTRTGSRSATSRSGSRWEAQGRSSGSPT